MKNIVRLIMNYLLQSDKVMDDYCERFIKPLWERAEKLGIPDDEFDRMWRFAWQVSQPLIVGQAPGSILRNLIDHWEADAESCRQFIVEESKALGIRM